MILTETAFQTRHLRREEYVFYVLLLLPLAGAVRRIKRFGAVPRASPALQHQITFTTNYAWGFLAFCEVFLAPFTCGLGIAYSGPFVFA